MHKLWVKYHILGVDTPLWRFYWWLAQTFIRPPQRFFDWFVKSCQYSWFLRNDYDWDSVFLLKLMHFKMNRMQKNIGQSGNCTNNKKIAREIRASMRILNRLIEDDYILTEMKILSDKHPFFEESEEVKGSNGRLFRSVHRNYSKADWARFKKYSAKEEVLRRRDERAFFGILQKRFRGWWD